MLKRIGRRRLGYDPGLHGPLDEDAAPGAAAVLAALTDPVPAHAADRPVAHLGRLAWRAAGLVAVAVLAYLPTLLNPALLDGEADGLKHLQAPSWAVADAYQLPLSVARYPATTPRVLRHLVRVEARLLGDEVLFHHALGLCLHAAAAVLVWAVLRRASRPGAWLAAAAFAANPGAAAAVEWVGQRGRLWAAGLALLGAGLLLRSLDVPARPPAVAEADEDDQPTGLGRWAVAAVRPVTYALALVAFLLTSLVQPTAAAVGLAAALLVVWRKPMRPLDWAAVAPLAALAAVVAVAVVVRPAGGSDPVRQSVVAVVRPLWDTGRAIERVAWPFASADLTLPGDRSRAAATCGLGGAFWVALAAAVGLRRRVGAGPAVALGSFALLLPTTLAPPALPPVPGLTAATQAAAAGTYLLAIPVLAVLADAVIAACRRLGADLAQRSAEVAAAAAALAGLGGWTAARAAAFGNTEAILRTAISVNHGSWPARAQMAQWDLQAGRADAALEALDGLTLASCPDPAAAIAEGDLLSADGDSAGALAWYRRAGELDPDDVTPVEREADTYLHLDRPGDAIDRYLLAVGQHPDSAALRSAFGELLLSRGENSPAAEQFREQIRLDPDSPAAHADLGSALIQSGQLLLPQAGQADAGWAMLQDGAGELKQAIDLDPDNFKAYHNAGITLAQLHDFPGAITDLTNAVRIRPESPQARNDLGVVLVAAGKFKQAEFELNEALRLRPDYADAQRNLTIAKARAEAQRQRASVEGK